MDENSELMEGVSGEALTSARSRSLLKEAERRRSEREHNLFLDIPTWDGDLICEYRVVPGEELEKIAQKVLLHRRNGKSDIGRGDIELIVTSHVGLYMRDRESGDRVAIEDEFGHVGYGRIANMLGKEDLIKSNADAVRYLMSERNDDGTFTENIVAIGIHANAISKWMQDTSKRSTNLEELLGE